jgi:hypothetical protein
MRLFLQKWSICFSLLTLLGCATVTQTEGTVASPALRDDVMRMIGNFEAAAGRNKQPSLLSARGVGRTGSTVVEHWIVGSILGEGARVTYEVSLTPSPRGGVDYRVRPQLSGSATPTRVTLKDGKTYEIETVRGLPVRFSNDQIRVQDLGITAIFVPLDRADAPPFVWAFTADLIAIGLFEVTVTTPLDSSASVTRTVKGPDRIRLDFFPQDVYPLIWEGIDQPGVHWFPFHFVFEERQSKKRFEFTQWSQMDYESLKQQRELMRELSEKIKRGDFKK